MIVLALTKETDAFVSTFCRQRTLPIQESCQFQGSLPFQGSLAVKRHDFNAWALSAEKNNKGVYSRPSAAIERGSGFFIPGLEGPKVRLLFGMVVLALTAVNRFLNPNTTGFLTEALAIGYAILLLLQAAIEFGKEEKGFVVSLDRPNDDGSRETMTQRWQTDNSALESRKEQVEWSAASFVALTPATQMILIQSDKVLYRLGGLPSTIYEDESKGCIAALETIGKAKSGRVSIPATHQASIALVNEVDRRCVVLQTINERECWMMTSNQLLAAFTSQDLKWLGQLAKYVAAP
jgi:hypothetical protein